MKSLFNKFSATQKKTLLIAMVAAWIANSIPIINFATHYYTMPSQHWHTTSIGW